MGSRTPIDFRVAVMRSRIDIFITKRQTTPPERHFLKFRAGTAKQNLQENVEHF